MNITYTWRNTDKTDAVEELTTKKLEKVAKHLDKINQIQVIFDCVKQDHIAKASLHVPGEEINAHASDEDMYKAVDGMINKLSRQIDAYKEKLKSHRDQRDQHDPKEV